MGLGAAVWVQIAAGSSYNFALYSHALKYVLGLNQQQLTILGVANDIGESVGLLPGLACNIFPPWAVLLVGAVCCFVGYGAIWLAVSRTVPNLPYWLVSLMFLPFSLFVDLSFLLRLLYWLLILKNLMVFLLSDGFLC